MRTWRATRDGAARVGKSIAEARSLGYQTLTLPGDVNDPVERRTLLRSLDHAAVGGLILTPPCGDDDALVAELERCGTPDLRIAPNEREGTRLNVSAQDFDYGAIRALESIGNAGGENGESETRLFVLKATRGKRG